MPDHPCGLKFDCVKKTYAGDYADESLLKTVFRENRVDLVVHSLSTTIPLGTNDARYDIESNLIPTIKLLDCMIEQGVKDIVYISSGGAVYGNGSELPHKEDENTMPISSYGVVKLTVEKYLMQYGFRFGLRPLIVRLSNPYGPFHYSMRQGLVNVALSSALKGTDFYVWGDGSAKKDYIYVRDFTSIMFQLIQRNVSSKIVNIGSGCVVSVNQVLRLIQRLVPSFTWKYEEASKVDVSHFELDTSCLQSIVGPYHFTAIEDGLAMTYQWAKQRDK